MLLRVAPFVEIIGRDLAWVLGDGQPPLDLAELHIRFIGFVTHLSVQITGDANGSIRLYTTTGYKNRMEMKSRGGLWDAAKKAWYMDSSHFRSMSVHDQEYVLRNLNIALMSKAFEEAGMTYPQMILKNKATP